MTEDKENWFSALNADEVVVGSVVLAGNTVDEIELKMNTPDISKTQITAIRGEDESSRFVCLDGQYYDLVYVLEMAQKEGAWTDGNFPQELVGDYVKYKDGRASKFVVTGWKINSINSSVCVANMWMSYQDLYDTYVRMDGSPCGFVAPIEDNQSVILPPTTEEESIGANINDIQHTDGEAYN